ncbi:MAG: hypothetical protein OJF50_006485 [Nitrospira sp.]|jgi:chromosome segregation ATPase|nr:hypothetical protein [Nitrospira sp.]
MNMEPISIRLPLNQLSINPTYQTFAPPLAPEIYASLKDSIRKAGTLLCPIIVEYIDAKNTYDIIDGYNRYEIVRACTFPDIPCTQIFTEDQRIEALMANVNRRQLTADQRTELLRRSRELISRARQSLIAPLAELHKNAQLAKYVGHHNVHYLMGASWSSQETFYAEIREAFAVPTPSNKREAQLLEELKKAQASLAITQSREGELERRLRETTAETTALQAHISACDGPVAGQAHKVKEADKSRLTKQVESLQRRFDSLKEEKNSANQQIRVLQAQVKSAEAEMAAAQMAAKDAEKRLRNSTQRLGNPQLITASFDSLLKLAATLESLIQQAGPLAPEHIKACRQDLTRTRERLADLDAALIASQADVIPIHRHVKG